MAAPHHCEGLCMRRGEEGVVRDGQPAAPHKAEQHTAPTPHMGTGRSTPSSFFSFSPYWLVNFLLKF